MNCQEIGFSAEKSQERMSKALNVFDSTVLNRILALGLHLQGVSRKEIASLVDRPEESVKTSIRVLLRDGFSALRDRRQSSIKHVPKTPSKSTVVSTRQEGKTQIINLGVSGRELRIPVEHKIQLRTILLSFLDSGLLSLEDTALALGISKTHCCKLKTNLTCADVEESLIDKRQGQMQDYRMGAIEKAELIQQFASRAVLRLSTSSKILEELLNKDSATSVSARTIRWHMKKLGLTTIRKTLPNQVDAQKKLLSKAP